MNASIPPQHPRRSNALTQERITEATIELLDTAGENALTVRALTAHLNTGRGAIYHHVASKEALLAAAADAVVGTVLDGSESLIPRQTLRACALGVFDALVDHPWVGAQLGRDPRQPAVHRIWKAVGSELERIGIDGAMLPDAGAALVNYILGAAAQYSANAGLLTDGTDRNGYLDATAAELTQTDPDTVTRLTAAHVREHDDRQQFLAGVDIFLAGIAASHHGR